MVNNPVSQLIYQHKGLVKNVTEVGNELKEAIVNYKKIEKLLVIFRQDLVAHLKFENEKFYKELIKRMKAKGQDTEKTEKFIAEMKKIEQVVVGFLEKYNTSDSIKNSINDFKAEFKEIVDTLALRIDSEESGVFSYWGLF